MMLVENLGNFGPQLPYQTLQVQENPTSKRHPFGSILGLHVITESILQCNLWAIGWSSEGTF